MTRSSGSLIDPRSFKSSKVSLKLNPFEFLTVFRVCVLMSGNFSSASAKFGKQSSASFVSSAGKHILSVRRGHGVFLWDNDGFPAKKQATTSRSFEYFNSPGVSVAAAWSPTGNEVSRVSLEEDETRRALRQLQSSGRLSRSSRVTATWPEEKLTSSVGGAWRLVIVTASLDGVIRTFHNYGLPRNL